MHQLQVSRGNDENRRARGHTGLLAQLAAQKAASRVGQVDKGIEIILAASVLNASALSERRRSRQRSRFGGCNRSCQLPLTDIGVHSVGIVMQRGF
jgi:hypothetical protein